MYSAHIGEQLQKIKELLANQECQNIKVISTQLIEAGVDIDFPIVYRQEAGLDSIIQAAGRCNREGKFKLGKVVIFKIKDRPLPPGLISKGNSSRLSLSDSNEIHNPKIIKEYYERLYRSSNTFDSIKLGNNQPSVSICDLLYRYPLFETVGENFRLIDSQTYPITIANSKIEKYLYRTKDGIITKSLLNKLAPYTVEVTKYNLEKLKKMGMIEEWVEGYYVMSNPLFYGETGIKINEELNEEIYII